MVDRSDRGKLNWALISMLKPSNAKAAMRHAKIDLGAGSVYEATVERFALKLMNFCVKT